MNEPTDLIERGGDVVGRPAPTPLAILSAAVAKGVDPATLKQLMDLQERYEANEARKDYEQAMAKFKANPPRISKNKDVKHNGKYMYSHATLDNACDQIGAALAQHGLSFRWKTEQIEGGLIRVACILTHQRGHSTETWLQASPDTSGAKNSIQAVGSTVSYLSRYTLLAATGMAVADGTDDDAQQGKLMSDSAKADWLVAIDSCADMAEWDATWAKVAQATTAAGDVEAHEVLKAAAAAKRKALRAAA